MRVSILMITVAIGLANADTTHVPMGTESSVLNGGTKDPTLDEGTDGSGMDEATMDTNELMIEMEDQKANSRGYCFRQCKGTGNARKCKCHPPGCGKCD